MNVAADTAAQTAAADKKVTTPDIKKRARWEAADTVIAASATLVAIIVGIFVLLCFQGYSTTIESTKQRAQQAADAVAEGTRWTVGSAIALLDGVAVAAGNDPQANGAATWRDFQVAVATIPARFHLGIYDAAGEAVENAITPGLPQSIADTDFFARISDANEPLVLSALTATGDGEARFFVVKRLQSNGRLSGVALVGIFDSVLARLSAPQDLGADSSVSLIREDGLLMARYPSVQEAMDVSGLPNFQAMITTAAGSYVSGPSLIDGIARIISYRRVDDLGFITIAAISQQEALKGLWYSIWVVSLLIAPIAAALLVGSFITARVMRRTQATSRSLAEALAHNEVLFREIHHRVKNNLQAINSLLQLHPIPREVRADMSQRIAAMSAVHEHIYRSHTFTRVQVKDYLHKLIDNIQAGNDPSVQVIARIEDVAVEKDAATPLGLIVNEVVSNAFKHAFGDGRSGTIEITLVGEGDTARLTVHDNGTGFDPEAPAKGIGRRLIGGLTAQLHGESTHTSDAGGSTFTLTFPLARE